MNGLDFVSLLPSLVTGTSLGPYAFKLTSSRDCRLKHFPCVCRDVLPLSCFGIYKTGVNGRRQIGERPWKVTDLRWRRFPFSRMTTVLGEHSRGFRDRSRSFFPLTQTSLFTFPVRKISLYRLVYRFSSKIGVLGNGRSWVPRVRLSMKR